MSSHSSPPLTDPAVELALLRQMVGESPVIIAASYGPEHRLTFFNEEFRAYAKGRAKLGETVMACAPEIVPQGLVAVLDGVYRTGQPFNAHETNLHLLDPATGQLQSFYFNLTFKVVRDAEGQVYGINAFLTDVSAHVRARQSAEQQLVEQREFYETLLREMPAGIVAFDADHRYLYYNPESLHHTMSPEQLLGKTNAEASAERGYPPALAEERQRHFDEALRTRDVCSWEETLMSTDGPRRILRSMRPVFNPDGSLRMMVSSGLNVTERRRAEALMQQQQQLTQHIIDTIPFPVFVSDAAGNVTFANAANAEASRSFAGRTRLFRQNAAQVPEFQQMEALKQQVRNSGQGTSANIACTSDLGQVHYCQLVMRPLPQSDGAVHVLTISIDVTDLKEAQRAATENAQAQERFLATMSHEIRTPLNGVLGMAGLLAKTPLNREQQRYLDVVQHSGQHLMGIINDVLDMAKITANQLQLEYLPFNLCNSIEAALEPMVLEALEKGLVFETLLPCNAGYSPWVLGDPHRLNQVLINLVSNALKFTNHGLIKVQGELVNETAEALTVRFSVADTGIGIALSQRERVFESFAQASADTSRQYGGTGLGLSISQALVAQLGGTLTLDSEEGYGSTFTFAVTLAKATAPPAVEAPSLADAATVRGWRILLVDDNALNLELAKAVLEQNGMVVDAALTGLASLALFDQHLYKAVLMDINMPGMNGLEATARMRQHPDPVRAATPVLAMTADAFRAQQERYRAAGMNDCITKPFTESELLRKLVVACAVQ